MTCTTGTSAIITAVTTYEMACRRFSASFVVLLACMLWASALVVLTGFEIFRGILPDGLVDNVASLHLNTLSNFTIGNLIINAIQIVIVLWIAFRKKS